MNKVIANYLLRQYGRLNSYLGGRLPPLFYFLYLTKRCNLKCKYCWQTVPPLAGDTGRTYSVSEELSTEEWLRVIDNIRRPAAIAFSGGEPFCVPGFDRLLRAAAKRLPVSVNSNGVMLTPEYCKLLIDLRIKNVSISLDGFAGVHDAYCGPGIFNRVVDNLHALNNLKEHAGTIYPRLSIKTTLSPECIDQLEDFAKFAQEELNASVFNLSFAKSTYHAQYSHRIYESFSELSSAGLPTSVIYPNIDNICAVVERLRAGSGSVYPLVEIFPEITGVEKVRDYLRTGGATSYAPCFTPWATAAVLGNGEVIPCLSVGCGSVRENDYTIHKIWRQKTAQKFRCKLRSMQRNNVTPTECNCCCFLKAK